MGWKWKATFTPRSATRRAARKRCSSDAVKCSSCSTTGSVLRDQLHTTLGGTRRPASRNQVTFADLVLNSNSTSGCCAANPHRSSRMPPRLPQTSESEDCPVPMW